MNIIASNSNSLKKKKKNYMLKYENSTLKIDIRTIKHYWYRSNCWLRTSCQQNRSENGKNSFLKKLKLSNAYSEAITFEQFLKN